MSMVNGEIREGASALNAPKSLQDAILDPLEYEKSKTFLVHSNLKFENFRQKCF